MIVNTWDQSLYKRIYLYEFYSIRNVTGIDVGTSRHGSNYSYHNILDPQKLDRGVYKLKTSFNVLIIKTGGERKYTVDKNYNKNKDANYLFLWTGSFCQIMPVIFLENDKFSFIARNIVWMGVNNDLTVVTLRCTKNHP